MEVIDMVEEENTMDNTDDEPEIAADDEVMGDGEDALNDDGDSKKSTVFLHSLSHHKCLQFFDHLSYSVVCRAPFSKHLKVLEALCISLYKPDLCKQKKHLGALRLFS
eukprot:scpid105321/ scgid27149/ 